MCIYTNLSMFIYIHTCVYIQPCGGGGRRDMGSGDRGGDAGERVCIYRYLYIDAYMNIFPYVYLYLSINIYIYTHIYLHTAMRGGGRREIGGGDRGGGAGDRDFLFVICPCLLLTKF